MRKQCYSPSDKQVRMVYELTNNVEQPKAMSDRSRLQGQLSTRQVQ